MKYLKYALLTASFACHTPVFAQDSLFRFEHFSHIGTRVVQEGVVSISSEVCANSDNEDSLQLVPDFFSTDSSFLFASEEAREGEPITLRPGECQEFQFQFQAQEEGSPMVLLELQCHYQNSRCDRTFPIQANAVTRDSFNSELERNGLVLIGAVSLDDTNILLFSGGGRKLHVGNREKLKTLTIGVNAYDIQFSEAQTLDPPLPSGEVCSAGTDRVMIREGNTIHINQLSGEPLAQLSAEPSSNDFITVFERDGLRMVRNQCPTSGSENDRLSGRLEIFDGNWGTICHHGLGSNNYTNSEAGVACQQLDLDSTMARALPSCPGSDPIERSQVSCVGNETRLQDCLDSRVSGFCSHEDDIGASCGFSLSGFVTGCSAVDSEFIHLVSSNGFHVLINKQALLRDESELKVYPPSGSGFMPEHTTALDQETLLNSRTDSLELTRVQASQIQSVDTQPSGFSTPFVITARPGNKRAYASAQDLPLVRYNLANDQIERTMVSNTNIIHGRVNAIAASEDGLIAVLHNGGRTVTFYSEPEFSKASQLLQNPLFLLLAAVFTVGAF